MDESGFWQLIERVRCADDDEHLERLTQSLQVVPLDDLFGFHRHFDRLVQRAYTGDLWAAAMLLNGGFCSDDGFQYFRAWLISRGRETYERALQSPDSLAQQAIEVKDQVPRAEFESYGYAAADAYERRSGENLWDALPEPNDAAKVDDACVEVFDWQTYTNDVLARRLPELWARYGRYKQQADAQEPPPDYDRNENDAVDVPGLGQVRIGSRVAHQSFGPGTVRSIERTNLGVTLCSVEFEDRSRFFVMDAAEAGLWRPL